MPLDRNCVTGKGCVRRAMEARRRGRRRRQRKHLLFRGARLGHRRFAGRALLEEELGRADARIRVEALHHHVAEKHVRERDEAHSLVVRECRAHDDAAPVFRALEGVRLGGRIPFRVIERIPEAPRAVGPRRGEQPGDSSRPSRARAGPRARTRRVPRRGPRRGPRRKPSPGTPKARYWCSPSEVRRRDTPIRRLPRARRARGPTPPAGGSPSGTRRRGESPGTSS